jgi:hypothetical protein
MSGPVIQKKQAEGVASSKRDPVADWLGVFVPMLGLPAKGAAELRDELEDHLRARVDDLMITGSSEAEATRRAVAELGKTAELARTFRSARSEPRRRRLMQFAILGVAGVAAVMSTVSLVGGPTGAA